MQDEVMRELAASAKPLSLEEEYERRGTLRTIHVIVPFKALEPSVYHC